MKNLFRVTAIFVFLVFAAMAQATTVTIDSQQIPNLQYTGTTFTMKIWVEAGQNGFTDSSGIFHIAGAVDSKNVYKTVTCTLSGTTGTCPSFTLDSTTDSLDYPSAKYHAWLYDSRNVKRDPWFVSFPVPPVTPTTWAQLRVYKNGQPKPNIPGYLNRDEVYSLINIVLGTLNDASTSVKGRVLLSSAPVTASLPIAVSDTDPRLVGLPLSSNAQLPPSTGSRVCYANQVAGADASIKINACDAALGSNSGIIYWFGDSTLSAQIIISQKHTLHFTGTLTPSEGLLAPLLLKEDSRIEGEGWNKSVIMEPTLNYPSDPNGVFSIITGYGQYNSNGTTTRNVQIKNLEVRGNRTDFGSVMAAITLGNCHGCIVDSVYINSTHSIGMSVGGSSTLGADTLGLGRYAEDVWVTRCRFYQVASQNLALVNGRNVHFYKNDFLKPGQPGGPSLSVIDLESNQGTDKIELVSVTHNHIDAINSPVSVNGIAYQSVGAQNGPGIIADNEIIGRIPNGPVGNLSNGIFAISSARDVTISNNVIIGAQQAGITIGGVRYTVSDNTLVDTGGSGIGSLLVTAVNDSFFSGNNISSPDTGYSNSIIESGGSTGNRYRGNRATGGIDLAGTSLLEDNAFISTLSPPALSGDVNNYNPTYLAVAFTLRIDGGAANRNITGLAGGVAGRTIQIVNTGATNTLTLVNSSASSTAANRFLLSGNLSLAPNTSATLRYDEESSRWRMWSPQLNAGTDYLSPTGSGSGLTGITETSLSTSDITTLNATSSKHGLLPKLSGLATDVLRGDGTFGTRAVGIVGTGPISTVAAASTVYICPNTPAFSSTENIRQWPVPLTGTVRRLYILTNSAQPGDGTLVVTVQINGTPSTVVVTIPAGSAAGVFSDTTHSIAVTAGQLISFKAVNSSPGTASASVITITAEIDQ